MSVQLLQGNNACAAGALAVGCRFFAGYPITPSSEIAETMARELPRLGGKFIQMEDEIASIAAVIGASVGGLKAMTATSGPGKTIQSAILPGKTKSRTGQRKIYDHRWQLLFHRSRSGYDLLYV